MSAHDAAPGVVGSDPGSGLSTGSATSIPPDRVPERVLRRLADVGVHSLTDWKALGRRRFEIFGVTARWVSELDELARALCRASR